MARNTCNVLPSAATWAVFTKNLRLNLLLSPKLDFKKAWGQKGLINRILPRGI